MSKRYSCPAVSRGVIKQDLAIGTHGGSPFEAGRAAAHTLQHFGAPGSRRLTLFLQRQEEESKHPSVTCPEAFSCVLPLEQLLGMKVGLDIHRLSSVFVPSSRGPLSHPYDPSLSPESASVSPDTPDPLPLEMPLQERDGERPQAILTTGYHQSSSHLHHRVARGLLIPHPLRAYINSTDSPHTFSWPGPVASKTSV